MAYFFSDAAKQIEVICVIVYHQICVTRYLLDNKPWKFTGNDGEQ